MTMAREPRRGRGTRAQVSGRGVRGALRSGCARGARARTLVRCTQHGNGMHISHGIFAISYSRRAARRFGVARAPDGGPAYPYAIRKRCPSTLLVV